jgi:hypothetical protein
VNTTRGFRAQSPCRRSGSEQGAARGAHLGAATGDRALQSISVFSRASAQAQLAARMGRFARDVKSLLNADVLPRLRARFPALGGVGDTLSAAFDASVDGMSDWIWRPIRRGTRSLRHRTRSLLRGS